MVPGDNVNVQTNEFVSRCHDVTSSDAAYNSGMKTVTVKEKSA